jgi:hypothetical protein
LRLPSLPNSSCFTLLAEGDSVALAACSSAALGFSPPSSFLTLSPAGAAEEVPRVFRHPW